MSIATDEAEKYFPTQYWPHMEPNGDYRGKECYIEGVKSSDIREAYEQGRTAEPTEAEIEAAVNERDRHGYCQLVGTPIVCMCGARLPDDHSYDVHLVRAMLDAARKAVTE